MRTWSRNPTLLVAYRYIVRYTFVGRLLNGSRTRAGDEAGRAAQAAST